MKRLRSTCRMLAAAFAVAAAGAVPEPTDSPVGEAWKDPRNPIVRIFGGRRLDLWSLRPLQVLPSPGVAGEGERGPIDRWIRHRLEAEGLRPSPEADRRTLLRRLAFDLTGLPPAAEDIAAFERDPAPDAYERQVDRLLAPPRYGEHQARLWLDVVRYSDSNGFDWDEFRPRAWRFRDYVVRSFNADKPFARFVTEQLAGDELVPGEPADEAERDAWIATGYLRLGPHDNAAPLFNEQDRSRAELMADLVETTTGAFLGLTYSCCRCHDHKFDPVSHADHYRMRAFFEGVRFADDRPIDLAPGHAEVSKVRKELEERIAGLHRQQEILGRETRQRLRQALVEALSEADRHDFERSGKDGAGVPEKRLAELRKKVEPSPEDVRKALDPLRRAAVEKLDAEEKALRGRMPEFTFGLLMTDAAEPPRTTRILFQGDHRSEREAVEPGFPTALAPGAAPIRPAPNPRTLGRRLALAEWIVSPANPLAARVFVNRVWQQHFGVGLVATPNDFGLAGARPSHPGLLDLLASEFLADGGSVKRLHRRIVTSATYRQSSAASPGSAAKDAANVWLSHQNPRRLTAEQLRDALLAVSGRLRESAGGPPVWPELPPEILQANPAFLDDNETRTKGWYPSAREVQDVRSLYLVQKRTVRVPFLETFDLPENSTSCARRVESTVAPQALSLLNSPLSRDVAQSLAALPEVAGAGDPDARIRRLFLRLLQREPAPAEAAAARRLLETRSLPELARALFNVNEFLHVD